MPHRHPFIPALSAIALLCLPLLTQAADYRFGVFAGSASKDNQADLRAEFKPLVDLIAKETGSNVKLEISQSFKNMENRLNNAGHFAILLAPAQVTADAIKDGYTPVAKWNKPLAGVFVVSAKQPYKNIAALKGTRFGIASRDTAVGPLCMGSLNKAGLRADRDMESIYEGKFMDVMFKELKTGSLDAICVSPVAWKTMNTESPGEFRILAETPRIPGFALSLSNDLSAQEKKKLTAVLTSIGKSAEGKAALAAITGSASGATDTLVATSEEYETASEQLSQGKRFYDQQMPK